MVWHQSIRDGGALVPRTFQDEAGAAVEAARELLRVKAPRFRWETDHHALLYPAQYPNENRKVRSNEQLKQRGFLSFL